MIQCTFTALLNSFLLSPASQQKKILAHNFDVKICECYALKAVTPCKVGFNSLKYKEARFTGKVGHNSLSMDSLLECLSNFEIQLKRLEIESYMS